VFIRYEARSEQGVAALEHYAGAVAVMKGRDPAEKTSWAYQAAIHGTFDEQPAMLQNQCEHESWFFFPWHRIYLYYFEEIVRKAVVDNGGPEDWALPYWNYGLGGEHAELPEAFRIPADEGNALYVSGRNPYYNSGEPLPELLAVEGEVLRLREFIGRAMFGGGNNAPLQPRFAGQAGPPEISPHGAIHVELGGWMGVPETAAQDPIFWLHHCNIDRIWAVWNEREGKSNPGEGGWLNHSFDFFDAGANQVAMNCGNVTATQLLDYTYDPPPAATVGEVTPPQPPPSPGAPEPPSEPKFVGASEEAVPLVGDSVEVPVEIDPRAREEVLEAADPEDPRHLYLNIEEIRGERTPNTVYAMYLNLPGEPKSADYDRHYIGNAAFFGIERSTEPAGDEAPHGMQISVEVGDVVQALSDTTDWDQAQLRICFRPVVPKAAERAGGELLAPFEAGHDPIQIGRISLAIDA
jgi:tyrosinase